MEPQQNIPPNFSKDLSNFSSPNLNQESNSTPPRWLNTLFKTWAIICFILTAFYLIFIVALIVSRYPSISVLTEISPMLALVLFGMETHLVIFGLILLFPIWGTYKLRKWIFPIYITYFLFYLVNLIIVLTSQQFDVGSIFSLGDIVIVITTIIIFIYRDYFSGSFKKLSIQIPILIISLPMLVFGTLTLLYPDLPKINDSDILPTNFQQPKNEENLYFSLIQIKDNVYFPDYSSDKVAYNNFMQYIAGTAWNQTEVNSILSKNELVLNTLRSSIRIPYLHCPTYDEHFWGGSENCPLNLIRNLGTIASLSALSMAVNGDLEGAMDDAFIPLYMSQSVVSQQNMTLIDGLVGVALKNIGARTLQIILAKYEIPSKILLPKISQLQQLTQNGKNFSNVWKFEYMSEKNSLASLTKISSNFWLQPNRFFSEMAGDVRNKILITETPCYQIEVARTNYKRDLDNKLPKINVWMLPFTRNAFYEVLKRGGMVDISSSEIKRCEADSVIEQTVLQIALAAFKSDKGKFPSSQSDLIPTYISEPIINPMTNTEFIFDKDTGFISK